MFETINKWRGLEYKGRKNFQRNFLENKDTINVLHDIIAQDFKTKINRKDIQKSFESNKIVIKKINFIEAAIEIYPYIFLLLLVGVALFAFTGLIFLDLTIALLSSVIFIVVSNFFYIKIKTKKIRECVICGGELLEKRNIFPVNIENYCNNCNKVLFEADYNSKKLKGDTVIIDKLKKAMKDSSFKTILKK